MKKEKRIIMNRIVDAQYRVDGFELKVQRDILLFHNKAIDSILKRLKKTKGRATKQRMLKLLDELIIMVGALEKAISGKVSSATVETALFSQEAISAIISWDYAAKGFNDVRLSKGQLVSIVEGGKLGGKTIAEWIGSAYLSEIDAIKAEVVSGALQGLGYKALISRMDNGLRGAIPAKHLETIVKSYIQAANVQQHRRIFRANKEVISHVEWTAQLENANTSTGRGTCVRCQALDGMRWPESSPEIPNIPLHARCRCLLLPVTKTWKELGIDMEEADKKYKRWYERDLATRGKIDQGFTDKNYADFWKSKPPTWQDNAVGPRRAELLREGKIDFPDLVDKKTGRLRLLSELTT